MAAKRPQPILQAELCKGCGRCIDACPKHCIEAGSEINQLSGLVPIHIDYESCNGCSLCITACPEPYGLTLEPYELEAHRGHEAPVTDFELEDPNALFGTAEHLQRAPEDIPDETLPLPACEPMVLKGNYAAAVGALLAGCRHVFGYPITPSTEGAELMAKLLPSFGGVFLQAVSEVATVNHMYGCGGAGVPCMTFTSSPGLSLMLEGISYMIGAEVPAVFVNVMRGGPGLGNIGPAQSDIKLLCRGLGHGDTQAIVLAPSTPQEMLDLTIEAFRLAFKYRNPVFIAADGYLGQMTGRVELPREMVVPGLPGWAVYGDAAHRGNLISSIYLGERDLEERNEQLTEKYQRIIAQEQRSESYLAEDAEVLVIAANTPARMAKGAIGHLRAEGVKAGLFMPVTLWPFPIDALLPLLERRPEILVVEASFGQLEDELRVALSHAGVEGIHFHHLRHTGGVLPQEPEIAERVRKIVEVSR